MADSTQRELYLTEMEKISADLKRLLYDEQPWKQKKCTKSIHVHSMPSPSGHVGHVFRGETVIDMPPEKIFDMVHPTERYRFMWDPNVASCRLLEEISDNTIICHQIMRPQLMGLLSARDSVDLFKLEVTEKYFSSQVGSVEYHNNPVEPDCVRAWTYPTGIFIFPAENPMGWSERPMSKVIVLFQADARLGHIPPALLHAAMPTFIQGYFDSLRKSAEIEWTAPITDVPGRRTSDKVEVKTCN